MEHHPQLFRALIDSLPSPVFYTDAAGRCLGCNKAFEEYLGMGRAAIVGKTVPDIAPRGQAERRQAKDGELLAYPGTQEYEARVRCADGSERDVVFLETAYADESGAVAGLVGVILDHSARKRAERELMESEAKYRSIFESLHDIYYRTALDGTIEIVSPSVRGRAGYRPEELVGRSVLDVYADPAERQALVARIAKEHTLNDYEIKLKKRDGTVRQASLSSRVVFDGQGNPVAIEGVVRDIDERKRAQDALRENEERFRRLVDDLPEYVFVYRGEQILYANHTAVRALGYTMEQLTSKKLLEFIAERDRALVVDNMKQRAAGKAVPRYEANIIDAKGNEHSVLVNADPVVHQGRPAVLAVLYDVTVQKEMERALRESEEQYRLIAENTADTITVMDLGLNITYVSPAIQALRGFTPEEARGQALDQILLPDSLQQVQEVYREQLALEAAGQADPSRAVMMELKEYRKDGSIFWAEATVSFLRNDQGRAIGIVTSTRDITARKRAEQTLRESETRHRTLVEHLGEGIVTADFDEEVTYANPAGEKIFGVPGGTLVGRRITEYITRESAGRLAAETARRKQGEKSKYELEIVRPSGQRRLLLVTAVPMAGDDGSPAGTLAILQDVTEQRRRENELRKLSSAVEQSANAIVITDLDAAIVYVNRAFCGITGYSREEALGQNPRILKSGEMPAQEYADLWRTLTSGQTWRGEFHNKRKDGSLYWEQATITTVNDEQGKPAFYLAVKEDITMRRALEEERERLIAELQDSLDNIKTLKGLVPICSSCKKIRDDKGYWQQVEVYVAKHTEADFSHGLCEDCAHKLYPEYFADKKNPDAEQQS